VLTTRELAQLIRMRGLDLREMPVDTADTPFGERTAAGKLFGASGGVMEAAIRTAHWLVTGKELGELKVEAVRGMAGIKEARVNVQGIELGIAVANGLGNACKLLDQIRAGRKDLHFIEVMTCPGGCVAGGGQPLQTNHQAVRTRMQALYSIDAQEAARTSHSNPAVQRLYTEFLGKPLGHKSHELLHTRYAPREAIV
jgi:NADP-reducing hydrogenase subunit HndD